ncbi:hypothetical protein JOD62_002634 [Microbacterium keratanolyticum]|uniref:DinB family protein n=1 Tax=Microbacterium keratanolyticum TaxID=67574 RepID=A0A9W6M8T2_9MICO|nr:hypothetical protein [Microbacterium keratanolyticum]MBM7470086.1 hypothetical protein [Microbacterium keratanolyticum]GLK02165.1 hypothetical protein GCM10017596_18800 [Microbacterium keratanolyticum]
MISLLRARLSQAQRLYDDFLSEMTPQLLASRLRDLPSNTIGQQLWCVIGARESFAAAARAGAWQGFDCSLQHEHLSDAAAVRDTLSRSAFDVDSWVSGLDVSDEDSLRYALALLEHEAMHHGQLLRYLYAFDVPRPQSWQELYALDGHGG